MRHYAIVLAADLPTADEVLSVVREVGTIVDAVKVGEATVLEAGKEFWAESVMSFKTPLCW
jgi:orotidine-5'-phosphate decarboxylase